MRERAQAGTLKAAAWHNIERINAVPGSA